MGPRLFISRASLDKAGLIQPGSRIKHRTLIKIPDNIDIEKAVMLLERGLLIKPSQFGPIKTCNLPFRVL
ncbi:MAG: hypothetical protein Ct9H300mP23_10720 [Nitrospinota bacterium]|nr:MAG: hypothetical protein Ct9H300mP23_10720 [Nitrospinota bacterium]